MEVFLVGGAVRDTLLGTEPKDRDYVVVGSHDLEMVKLGYEQVGMDFPVYLHPETREEYALARRERKVGKGYVGFTFEVDDVSIEEDLSRRDLTINSMAMAKFGKLIDPFGGQDDLRNKVLRHTSDAFAEDPLRVIRLARFYARYSDFTIAPETKALCIQMVRSGQLNELSKERFWLELEKAFKDSQPHRFIACLAELKVFNHVKFFDPMASQAPWTLVAVAKEVQDAFSLEHYDKVRGHLWAAIVADDDVTNYFADPLAAHVYNALWDARQFDRNISAAELEALMSKHRFFQEDCANRVWAFMKALQVCNDMGEGLVNTDDVYQAWMAAKTVTAEPFSHLQGRAIGEAMRDARVSRIKQATRLT